ncbi:VanZ family protein, partial [uncultured Clostridium sp.]|uniref:VanZ family protein n=1 Tax=uncultured Clostridium sp. TaxID=59620 RepID=UPI0025F38625
GKQYTFFRYILLFSLGLYFLLLVSVTLFPIFLPHELSVFQRNLRINYIPFKSIISDIHTIGSRSFSLSFEIKLLVMNIGGNILLLLPLGLLLPILWTNLRNLNKIFLIGLFTSLSIEILQLIENILYLGFRSVDIDDVIFNVIGIILGYSLFKVLHTSKNKFQLCK